MKRSYRTALAAAAVALVLPVSGCAALISPQQTHVYQYNAGDGAWTSANGLDVRGLLLITNGDGQAQLLYSLVNTTNSPVSVTVSVGDVNRTASVPANGEIIQNPANENSASTKPLIVSNLSAKAGDLTDVKVTIGGTVKTVQTQVLDGSLPYYKTLMPTVESTPTSEPNATTSGTATPSSTDEATQEATEG